MPITTSGIKSIRDFIVSSLSYGKYDREGNTYQISLVKTELGDDSLKAYLYFDDVITGQLTNFKIYDTSDNVFAEDLTRVITKVAEEGTVLMFTFKVTQS